MLLNRSALVALTLLPSLLSLAGCKPHSSEPRPAPAPPPSAAVEPDDYRPAHPGHVNQRDPRGGFLQARTAPPAVHPASFRPVVFDGPPPEVRLVSAHEHDGHCGEIELPGGERVQLDCFSDDYGKVTGAATSMIVGAEDRAALRGTGRRKLPAVVDHRKDGTEGPVLSQGSTSACTSFSLVAAADHAAAHLFGAPPNLSPMHAWARYHQPRMSLADADNVGRGLADAAVFPFDPRLANEWQKGQARVDPMVLRRADSEAMVEISNITHVETNDLEEIKSVLAAGQDVWFAIKAAQGVKHTKKGADGESMISHFDNRTLGTGQRSAHALVLAGYEETPHGTFYLIHNSWGKAWGTEGYAWIWDKTLRANIAEAYVLQVRPTEHAHVRRAPPAHRFSACNGALVPDATTSQCVPACSDGGPRVNGVCPTADQ